MNQYSSFERKIAYILSKFPGLKLAIKKVYQKLNYIRHKKDYNFVSKYSIKKLTYQDKESYFGYYDKSPINKTNEYIIFQTPNVTTKGMPDINIPVDIILFDIKNDRYENIDQSYTYNWQQGTKLMWIDDYKFVYNNYDKKQKKYISKIYDVIEKQFKVVDFPIYDCFGDQFAISLNFERLNVVRNDYSYNNINSQIEWSVNNNDGLYYVDLESNSSKLILTIEDVIKYNQRTTIAIKHKFNHIMISPNGKKVMFMHRWFLENGRKFDTLYICNSDGTNLEILSDDNMVSHCFWYDDENIFTFLRDYKMGDKYYMIDIKTKLKTIIGEGIIDIFGDGHPHIFEENIIFDTYPNKARMKELYKFNKEDKSLEKLGEFFESFDFYGETRCDLHPRFSYNGKKVFFDSVHEGKRYLYMMDLEKKND